MGGRLQACALAVPVFACLLLAVMKFGFQQFVRHDVIGAAVVQLPDPKLNVLLSSTSLLCVGCTRGLGSAIAKAACARGARVTIVGRSPPSELQGSNCKDFSTITADLSSMHTALEVVQSLPPRAVDTVLFTVGIVNGAFRKESSEGIELEAAVSFLSRFVMTNALVAKAEAETEKSPLKSTEIRKPRIFVMGFPGNDAIPQLDDFNWEKEWQAWPSHMNTVIANDALVLGVAKAHPNTVNIFGLNPGVIKTELMFDFLGGKNSIASRVQQLVIGLICPSADQYAQTAVRLLVAPELEQGLTGSSFNQRGERIRSCPWNLAEEGNVGRVWDEAKKLEERALSSSLHAPAR